MARILRINHIGLAVQDGQAAAFWSALGLERAGAERVPAEAVAIAFFPVGASRLELLEPLGAEGPVQKFLANRGEGVHHICFEVDDIRGLLAQLAAAGIELVNAEPRVGAEGSLVAFIHPRAAHGVLVELRQDGTARPGDPSHAAG
ncbi:MAG TPA: methylmalonyl-CoA epimerase [Chloroflexia bacterium]|nr:methylmalonyl-CoA epimerase [Chloroflexia bacterium]